jgi:hypothetical protein
MKTHNVKLLIALVCAFFMMIGYATYSNNERKNLFSEACASKGGVAVRTGAGYRNKGCLRCVKKDVFIPMEDNIE